MLATTKRCRKARLEGVSFVSFYTDFCEAGLRGVQFVLPFFNVVVSFGGRREGK